jgi:endoglucanase
MIPNLKLRDLALQVARDKSIPIQTSYVEGGATDGGAIHLHEIGVPTVVIAVPARHIHSHSAIIHHDDYQNAVALLTELVNRLDENVVADLTI